MRAPVKKSVLALAPNARGLGYALFAHEAKLDQVGVFEARVAKNTRCLAKARDLLSLHLPDHVVMENPHATGARRQPRVVVLLKRLENAALACGADVTMLARDEVKKRFCVFGNGSKDDIAAALVSLYPQLGRRRPGRRQPWQSERHAMGVFDAVALGVTLYAQLARPLDE